MPAPISPANAITSAFDAMPDELRPLLLDLRARIHSIASEDPRLGHVIETLKWGQPSLTTAGRKAGTPIRLGVTKDGQAAIFVHCQSPVIPRLAAHLPPEIKLDGTRALHLPSNMQADHPALTDFIRTALSYRL
ncbi:MAG: DUF1801 domain-containing protein [Pseudomonadota bacterium]